ncbi:MAG: NAD(P)/FAD-dependent oxidoreductase [Anaerovoracaceae bacterium]|jgi:NAD(P)H-nitrite reductase large subunit
MQTTDRQTQQAETNERPNRFLVLGSGIAGMAAAEEIRRRLPDAEIRMVSEEEECCFNRPMLIQGIAAEDGAADLFVNQNDWAAQQRVELLLGRRAAAIDLQAHSVRLQPIDGGREEELSYDRLIYAAGAAAAVPAIPGADGVQVYALRTLSDMRQIHRAALEAETAVVIGGGMLGLEQAWQLQQRGLAVTVLEREERLMPGQLDRTGADLLKRRIERCGARVITGADIERIEAGRVLLRKAPEEAVPKPAAKEPQAAPAAGGAAPVQSETDETKAALDGGTGHDAGTGQNAERAGNAGAGPDTLDAEVKKASDHVVSDQELREAFIVLNQERQRTPAREKLFHTGREIPADMVILSTGVTPSIEPGRSAGLRCGGRGGRWIDVDEQMRTSDADIFAAGDTAALHGHNDAVWDEARAMGRVAGANAAGGRETYHPVLQSHVFNGFDTELFTMGKSSGEGTDGVFLRHADVEVFDFRRERYVRVSLDHGRVAGILLINAVELATELIALCQRGGSEEEARRILLAWRENHKVDFKQPTSTFRSRTHPR